MTYTRPARYTPVRPRRRAWRMVDDTERPTEAEWVDEPDADDEPPSWTEPDVESRWTV